MSAVAVICLAFSSKYVTGYTIYDYVLCRNVATAARVLGGQIDPRNILN